jgi:hypothetical protein
MKIRQGFVSNSSSASFIITFSSSFPIEEIEKYIPEQNRDISLSSDEGNNTYTLEIFTLMFNDWYDVEGWKIIRMLSEARHPDFSLHSIVQEEDQFRIVHARVPFENYIWDYEENPDRQKEIDKQYYQYLADHGVELSKEEIKRLLQ